MQLVKISLAAVPMFDRNESRCLILRQRNTEQLKTLLNDTNMLVDKKTAPTPGAITITNSMYAINHTLTPHRTRCMSPTRLRQTAHTCFGHSPTLSLRTAYVKLLTLKGLCEPQLQTSHSEASCLAE